MKKKILIPFSLIFMLSIYASCKKPAKQSEVKEVVIGEQTLAQTKATFLGKWKLNYRIGGYTGDIVVNYPNAQLLFTSSDSLYRWDNNVLRINSKVRLELYFYSEN